MAFNEYDSSAYSEDTLLAQTRLLTQQLEALTTQLQAVQGNSAVSQSPWMNYEYGASPVGQGGVNECQGLYDEYAQVNFMGSVPRTTPFYQNDAFNSYPQRNHPNLSYESENFLNPPLTPYQSHFPTILSQIQPPIYYPPPNQFYNPHTNQQLPFHHTTNTQNNQINPNTSTLESTLLCFMQETQSLFQNQDASIRNLENQIGQLSKQISERPSGSFPADTVPNPKEHCNAIVPRSEGVLGDKRPLTIPCSIEDIPVGEALIDSGASVNLMPLPMLQKLKIHEVQPTKMQLQLADGSIKQPVGIAKDLQVKVEQHIFPADFVILDMKEDEEVPLILGLPFLTTGRVLMDVAKRKLSFKVDEEYILDSLKDSDASS